MNNELLQALRDLEKERGIDFDVLVEAIEAALISAYKKNFGANQNVNVNFDQLSGEFKVYHRKDVVEEVEDPKLQISVEEAKAIKPIYEAGDVVDFEVTPKNFGRIAAQTAKQVVVQRIREAERDMIFDKYYSQKGDVITGIVHRCENRSVFIDMGNTEVCLAPNEQMPGENYEPGMRVKAYTVSYTHLLRLIGVDTKEIERDDAVLAIGRLGAAPGKAQWKSARNHDEDLIVDLSGELPGDTKVSLQINGMDNELIIHVNHQKLKLKYQSYDAFFVILDGHTLEIKFYQSRGYSLRREVFPEIIKGMTYRPKGASYRPEDYIGRNFRDFLPSEKCLEATSSVLSGEKNLVENIQIEVNTMFFLMSAYPQIDGEGRMEGCAVIFKDLTMVKQLQRHIKEKRLKDAAFSSIVGSSDAMRQTIEIASKISHTRSTVLILGESGTGKGLFARAIHDNSKNRAKSFVPINMAAIPPNLLESELFGYAAGAFTGAGPKGKIGLFKAADGGTVFLDEIGDMDLNLQAKILQVLQEGIIYPVGSVLPEKLSLIHISRPETWW